MARIRTIKPEFWRSPATAGASPWARLLYIAMWNWADDYGVAEWTPRELLGFAFPNDEHITTAEFQRLCKEVARSFQTDFYIVGGRRYYRIPSWDDHQKTERRANARNPLPDDDDSTPDQAITGVEEMRGNSLSTQGKTPAGKGKGTGEREQGNRGTGEGSRATEQLFDEAYEHWPKRVKRDEALSRFLEACRTQPPEQLALAIADFGDAYAATTTKQYTPALGVWLNQKRWTDELPTAPTATKGPATKADQNAALYHELYGGGNERARSFPAIDAGLST
ncbi:hypothetical protein E3T54_02840 [Cryobacterium sp. Sr8]|uniref:hypothetical protein n=1 Tax=Cryobacterium sp. Sr8 TaxID=1259203 RepID=UPI00106A5475|nr:hypothetical protein [Cryobacterium sp. Sr8]TFD80695.1 hypothetical protein E3T54_02840 [Cryobacterium sp. Sr8]